MTISKENEDTSMVDQDTHTQAYLLALPTLAPGLTQACWADVFKRLLDDHSAGAIFLYERQSNASLVRRPSGEIVSLASVFPLWLSSVAFSQDGLVMKHALDVAVMLDTLAYDPRLALTHLIPSAADLLVSLITRLEHPTATPESSHGIRYLVLHLIASAETKWSNVFHIVLENIFSKAIALHIANSEGAVSVEKILGNLAMLFEVCEEVYPRAGAPRPGFLAFQAYIVGHWQQVLLLFVSHPFMECRAMGYRVLANSRLWEATGEDVQPMLLSKMLMEAWFRHMKHRFLRITLHEREEENYVLDELQRLTLEIFLTADMNHLQREKTSLLDKVRECGEGSGAGGGSGEEGEEGTGGSTKLSLVQRPPQFITTTDLLNGELDVRDKFYINNIERTATLFYGYRDDKEMSKEHRAAISLSVLSHLTSKWPQQKVSFDAYDKVLPKNIPYAIDITTGNAFKDHPVLFLIIEQCSTMTHTSISDITRSILVYFIAFWHIPEVAKENTTLKYATQLEETSRLLMLLRPVGFL
ncbi:hypothetical protein BDF14DRAFT_1876715 [Spinellus fusiger]|nr:hypothetical protein BDF14DRAFT_1876715 [Spinellus fusiger]